MSNNIYAFDNLPCSGRQDVMNTRTYIRNIPSQPLQPYLNARPVLTKYSILPVVDPRKAINVPLIQQATFEPENIFNPGNVTASAPWSGYASNVNNESDLRGQIFALQECSQSTYVPGSKSSLYNVQWKNSLEMNQPFPELFKKETFGPTDTSTEANKIGYSLFNNATRQQLKDLTKQTKCD
jgi:hypothetical protein